MYCLDSDVLIDFLDGTDGAILRLPTEQWSTTVLNMQEVLVGFSSGSVHERRAREFFDSILVLPYAAGDVSRVLGVKRTLSGRGRPIGAMDEMISGICLTHGATIVTRNVKHFRKVKGLKVRGV